ncbi:MAG TPA: hypothetical protein VLK84_28855 [Longimicrobium sp.]|nr:hypothetical protein [Longimicrobium sp.]
MNSIAEDLMIPSHLLLAGLVITAFAACSGPEAEAGSGPGAEVPSAAAEKPDSILFLVQGAPQAESMEALYEGRIAPNPQGCIQTEGPSPATIVWPHGFTLEDRGGELEVKDATGRITGRIGGSFRFGGGQVPSNNYAFLPEPARTKAAARCPGDVWIVGDTNLQS